MRVAKTQPPEPVTPTGPRDDDDDDTYYHVRGACARYTKARDRKYLLAYILAVYANDTTRTCWRKETRLAKEVQCSPRQVRRLRAQLIDLGELVYYPRAIYGRYGMYYIPHYNGERGYDPVHCRWQGISHLCNGNHTPNIDATVDPREARSHPVGQRADWAAYVRRQQERSDQDEAASTSTSSNGTGSEPGAGRRKVKAWLASTAPAAVPTR